MQNAKQLLAATRARSVPAPLDGAVVHSPFAALRQSDGEKFGKWLVERGKRLLETAPGESGPVKKPTGENILPEPPVEVKDSDGKTIIRGGKGVIVIGPPN